MWVSLYECGGIACGSVCVSVGYRVWVSVRESFGYRVWVSLCECGLSRVG